MKPLWSIRLVVWMHILFAVTYSLYAQSKEPDLNFERFDTKDGLSQNTARALLQDSRGFIWVGTNDGLNRFDGHEFTVFRANPKDPDSLSSSHIFSLYEDSQGYLWVGTFNGLNRFDPETLQFTHYQHDPLNPNSISDNRVSTIIEDKDKNLWVGTYWGGLNRFEPVTGNFIRYKTANKQRELSQNRSVRSLVLDNKGNLWVATSDGINTYSKSSDNFKYLAHQPNDGLGIDSIYWDSQSLLWIGTIGLGLSQFDPKTNTTRTFQHDSSNSNSIGNNYVLSIAEDKDGNLWLGGDEQLNRYHREGNYFSQHSNIKGDLTSLSEGDIVELMIDKHGQLWLGSNRGGLSTLSPNVESFGLYKGRFEDTVYSRYGGIKAIIEDSHDQIWLGTSKGLIVLTQDMIEVERFRSDPQNLTSLSDSNVYALHEDKEGFIWVGTRRGGLNRFDPKTREFTHFTHDPENTNSISGDWILSIYQDSQGILWVGTFSNGLNRYNPLKNEFAHYKPNPNDTNSINHHRISVILEDSFGELWIAMHDGGLNKFNHNRTQLFSYSNIPQNPRSLSNDIVLSLHEDPQGRMWIGTMGGGLNRYNRQSDNFDHYRVLDGLSNDLIAGILSDNNGNLWLSTYNGITKFSPDTLTYKHYNENDGTQRQFNSWAAYFKGNDGSLFFGGESGLNRFQPRNIQNDTSPPNVVLTDFLLLNKSVPISPEPTKKDNLIYQLDKAIYAQKRISLDHKHSLFSFEFSALHYADTSRNQYSYKLEGWDKSWITTDSTRRHATYTNIPAGNYTFRVKASNKDGIWNEEDTSIDIIIYPPWYMTMWAYTTYCFTAFITVWFIIYLRTRQARMLAKTLSKEVEERTAKIEALLRQKDTLFTNISHEFRTPLTLILGSVDSLLATPQNPAAQKKLPIVKRNATHLLHMVEQLLDISHHEQLKEQQPTTVSVSCVLRYLEASFESIAKRKDINFLCHVQEELFIQCNQDALEKILTNLLSNAFKYTAKGGHICAELSKTNDGEVSIAISDSGMGIQLSDQKMIFERFTRTDNAIQSGIAGSGIGLALVDQLVKFYGGRIQLESSLGKGSRFNVIFPASASGGITEKPHAQPSTQALSHLVMPTENLEAFSDSIASLNTDDDRAIILIVDDNKDMCHYVQDCLAPSYQCILSNNPQQGFQIAIQVIPDIIISDVMMPQIDGIQLTHQLKQKYANEPYSHHPVNSCY